MKQDLPSHTVLFVKTGCLHSARAREFLAAQHVDFIERNVSEDREAATELKRLSNQDATPTLIYEGDVLSDFELTELTAFLEKHGVNAGRR